MTGAEFTAQASGVHATLETQGGGLEGRGLSLAGFGFILKNHVDKGNITVQDKAANIYYKRKGLSSNFWSLI